MISIDLRLFGSFRKYSEHPIINIELLSKCDVLVLKQIIAGHLKKIKPDLGEPDLVFDSALANEREILKDQDEITQSCTLAILPPVCGG